MSFPNLGKTLGLRRVAACLLALAASLMPMAVPAGNTWGTDLSDLWWNPDESGWGANIAHQSDVIFLTLFVYGSDSKVRWYVAPALKAASDVQPYGFTGTLYETTGPYLGGALFPPGNVVNRAAGTVTLTFTRVDQAFINYTVDGVSVTKAIERQTFRANNLTGSYLGAVIATRTGCGPAPADSADGNFEKFSQITVSHNGSAISLISTLAGGPTCTYTGSYVQFGRMGQASGSVACSNGNVGAFNFLETEASYQGFFTQYQVGYESGCQEAGHIGGMMR
jgi:hypothetical protein